MGGGEGKHNPPLPIIPLLPPPLLVSFTYCVGFNNTESTHTPSHPVLTPARRRKEQHKRRESEKGGWTEGGFRRRVPLFLFFVFFLHT